MSLETMTKLASTTVGAGGITSITFSSIPQGYTDLCIKLSLRGTTSANAADLGLNMSINGVTTDRSWKRLESYNNNTPTSDSNTTPQVGVVGGTLVTASTFTNQEMYFYNYSGNTVKTFSVEIASETSSTTSYDVGCMSNLWSNSAPISQLTFTLGSGDFAQFSNVTVYGIKNAQKTAGNSIKATGGNIIFDGTYVYHVFPTTGAFVPTTSLTADILQIAGGGGGNAGGAGGLLGFSNQSLSNGVTYTCTIGSGGTGSNAGDNGTNGSSSQFGSLTTSVGGGKGGYGAAGTSGASGGGGGSSGAGTLFSGGSASPSGQGNAGGNNSPTGYPNEAGGGGGGAGAAGSNGTSGAGGAGGVGSAAYSSWGIATGQGQNVSGTYYFAGGGGNWGRNSQASGGYGGGGNGTTGNSPAASIVNGKANTGGGAGATDGNPSGNGGSGIIIVRYKG